MTKDLSLSIAFYEPKDGDALPGFKISICCKCGIRFFYVYNRNVPTKCANCLPPNMKPTRIKRMGEYVDRHHTLLKAHWASIVTGRPLYYRCRDCKKKFPLHGQDPAQVTYCIRCALFGEPFHRIVGKDWMREEEYGWPD
jgi:hypothetical protein